MSRFQIIAKVPFLYLGDPLVKLNAERRPKWYARKAVLRIVQACGRSIRGVDDHAKTYILDLNFKRLLRDNMELFPEWFLASVVVN
jgi:Rad3-related DNA helicase